MSKIKFTTTLDAELLKQMKILAIKQNRDVNAIIEELFTELIEKLN